MSVKLGTTPIAGITTSTKYNAHDLFDFKWSDHTINDMNWLQSEGSWCDGTVYSNAYNHLVTDISGITPETETIAGYTVTFYRATDGHKICLAAQETTVSDIYTATGIAWYYILDTTNTRFKLPRSEWGFVGYRNGVGDYIAPGLPDVQGSVGALVGTNTSSGVGLKSGAFSDTTFTGTENWRGTGSAISKNNVHFKASKYNSLYGGSSTVQPPATQMYLYFYVGEFSQTATEQSAGLNAELFNGKADTDLGNITSIAKNTVSSLAMPDYKNGVTLSLAANTWRTVTKNIFLVMSYGNQSSAPNLKLKDENGTSIPSDYGNTYGAGIILASNLLYFCFGVYVPKGYSYSYINGTAGFTEYPLKGAS